jgi:hypothetical protein
MKLKEHPMKRISSKNAVKLIFIIYSLLYVLVGSNVFAASSNSVVQIYITPGATRSIDLPDNARSISITAMASSVISYFFEDAPPLTDSVAYRIEKSLYIPDFAVVEESIYMYTGSTINLTWSISSDTVQFYILRNEQNYFRFMNDLFFDSDYYNASSSDKIDFTATANDLYYLLWYNTGAGKNVQYELNFTLKSHDINEAKASMIGSGEFDLRNQNYNTVIVKNIGSEYTARVEWTVTDGPQIQTWMILLLIVAGVLAIIIVIVIIRKKYHQNEQVSIRTSSSIAPTQQLKQINAKKDQNSKNRTCLGCGSPLEEELFQNPPVSCPYCGKEVRLT